MVFIFAISLCVPLYAQQEDSINKQQIYGQALYERTCAILDETDANAQKLAENLVHTIMADQEIYALFNIGKNEGFTVAELLTFAKTIAQENEDQEVVEILQNVQEDAAKNWFTKNLVITTVGALVVAAGGIIAYLKQEAIIDLFSQLAEKLGFGVQPPQQTEAERQAAEQARIAAEQELARIEAELEEAKRELAAGEQKSARLKAEQKALKEAELERILQFDREWHEKHRIAKQANPEPIDLELGSHTDSSNGANETSSTNSADTPESEPVNPVVNSEEPQVSNVVSEEAPVKNLEPAVNLDDDLDSMPDLVPARLDINSEEPQVSDVTAEVKQVADNTQQFQAEENTPVDTDASVLQNAQQQKKDVTEAAPEGVVKKAKEGKVKKEKHHGPKLSDAEIAPQPIVEQVQKEQQQIEADTREEAKKAKKIKHYSGPRYSDSEGKEKKSSRRSSLDPESAKRLAEQITQLSEAQRAQAEEDSANKFAQMVKERKSRPASLDPARAKNLTDALHTYMEQSSGIEKTYGEEDIAKKLKHKIEERKEKAHKATETGEVPNQEQASDFVHRVFDSTSSDGKTVPRYRDRIRERSPQSREKSPQSREKSPLRAAVGKGTKVLKEVVTGVIDGLTEDGTGNPNNSNSLGGLGSLI